MYKLVKSYGPNIEEEVLDFWERDNTFKKSLSQRAGATDYVLFDGPPFATGLPHFGHFIPSTIKDIIPRYKTMKGFHVERRFGWDCHGLPVETLIEKELGINSKHEIESYGVANFNDKCRASVLKYTAEWRKIITRLGRWVDFDNDYKTMDSDYMESIWAVARALWDKGLIYEGRYILPYCPRCSTVLSTHELALGYKEKQDPAITVRFKSTSEQDATGDDASYPTYFLAWTTTPWTLVSNEGLCMGPDIDYVKLLDKAENVYYILAQSRVGAYYKSATTAKNNPTCEQVQIPAETAEYKIIYTKKGSEFLGQSYEPLFPYFKELKSEGAFIVLNADYVSTEDGTGIVHIAPAFGEDDSKVFKDYNAKTGSNIPFKEPIDAECRYTSEVTDYRGRFVKDCDSDIIKRLKAEKKLIAHGTIMHQYPHCWRCGEPLIYRGIGSWFVKVADYHERLLRANNQIKWQPAHIKDGRFGKWLSGARDWAVSRNRYWGNPIPIWKCSNVNCKHTICVGSRDQLQKLSGVWLDDLHKQFVDKVTFKCPKCGDVMQRISEVFDCWFESGSMPYAQIHWPFGVATKVATTKVAYNKDCVNSNGSKGVCDISNEDDESKTQEQLQNYNSIQRFPADFISEGLDQTRGWFYTLTVIGAHLFDSPAFKNCIVSGLVLASDGRKMSKSLKNYTDPADALQKFGADAIRLFLIHSAIVKADDLRYSDDGVRDVIKSILLPLWNSYSFFVTYANIDGVTPTGDYFNDKKPQNMLDEWLLSITQKLISDVSSALDDYDLSGAVDPIVLYIDSLNNWYIRRSRRRFWKSENDSDKREAYETLFTALKTFCLVACPVIPFITESMWQNLCAGLKSVHLCDYPNSNPLLRNEAVEYKMAVVQKAVVLGRSLRNTYNVKNRQPLASVTIVTRDNNERAVLQSMEDVIRDELNVKHVIIGTKEDELVEYRAKANFKVLGKALGVGVKEVASQILKLSSEQISSIIDGNSLFIDIKDLSPGGSTNKTVEINAQSIIVERVEKEDLKVQNDGTLTVGLDLHITKELQNEGYVKDLVRAIQNLRKTSGLNITDRIILTVACDESLTEAFNTNRDYVTGETLATGVNLKDTSNIDGLQKVEAGDKSWYIAINKQP